MDNPLLEKGLSYLLQKSPGNCQEIEVTNVSSDYLGGSYEKQKIQAKIHPLMPDKKSMFLVVKKADILPKSDCFSFENEDMDPAERYYRRWQYLRSLGIPTCSSMRIVEDNKIVMGDMTYKGSEFFGKAKWMALMTEKNKKMRRPLTATEKFYLQIPCDQIQEEIKNLQQLASIHNLRLPYDDPCDLLIHSNGTKDLLVLDLSGLQYCTGNDQNFFQEQLNQLQMRYDEMRMCLSEISA